MLERAQLDSVRIVGSIRFGRPSERSTAHQLGERGGWCDRVDEPPLDRVLALDAFHLRREHVSEVAAHVALVD